MRAHVGMGLPTKEDVERIVVYVILSLFGCFFGRSHFYMCFKMFFRLLLGMGGNKSVRTVWNWCRITWQALALPVHYLLSFCIVSRAVGACPAGPAATGPISAPQTSV